MYANDPQKGSANAQQQQSSKGYSKQARPGNNSSRRIYKKR